MSIEAMKQALEALESCTPADTSTGHVVWPSYDEQAVAQAITALDAAIEAAEKQEPVAWIQPNHLQQARRAPFLCRVEPTKRMSDFIPIYITPPAAQPERVVFPTMLRKMWSGGEVQAWLDENVNKEKT